MRIPRALLALALAATLATRARAATIDPVFPGFGGPSSSETPVCNAAALSGDTLFLAGSLRWAGPLTGGGVAVQASDLSMLPGFPHVNGIVLAATPDGDGGWFIGGTFTHVGGTPHANLAHIEADLTVDDWAPSTNDDVICVFATPSEVWFGGTFTSVNGQPASGFAGVSRETGSVVSSPAVSGLVAALAGDDARLYLGGEFMSVNGSPRGHLAALRLSDHALASWAPAANAGVYALRCANGLVYAGGNFSAVDGLARGGAAALDPATGAPSPWDPHMGAFNGYGVRALLAVDDKVYLGGGFLQMGGASRVGLAAVDTATGAVTAWDPQVRTVTPGLPPPTVTSLEMAGADLLAGGDFEQVGGSPRSDLARIDTATAVPVMPAPEAPAEARALAASGENVYVGGRFSTFAPSRRADLLAVRVSTGELLPWSPDATRDVVETHFGDHVFHASTPVAMAVDCARVYVVTSFHDVLSGADRQVVSAFSRDSGAALWTFEPTGIAKTLAVLDSVLVVGGQFMLPANGLLALDAGSGTPVAWDGSTSGGAVLALCPTPAGLAVGGTFSSADGQPRSNLALLERTGALVPDWDPGADGAVTALALAGSKLYCGGDFTRVGDAPRSHLAALSIESGAVESWDPGANAPVRALGFDDGIVYAGGDFTTVSGRPRTCLAALDAETGDALRWDGAIGLGRSVLAVQADDDHVFAGGTQLSSGTEPTRGFVALLGPETALDAGPRARSGRGMLHVEPQPAKSVAQVRLRLPRETDGEIGLFDLTGRRLAVLVPWGHHSAGDYTVDLEHRQLQPGIYLVRAITPEGDLAGKLVVVP